jgi:hypothetical protein
MGGAPIAIALVIDAEGTCAFRVVVDTTDHRTGAVVNRQRYRDYLYYVTGVGAVEQSTVSRLLGMHFDDLSASDSALVLHGIGYGPGHSRQSTVYFADSGIAPGRLEDQLPEYFHAFYRTLTLYGGACPSSLAGIAYDFNANAEIVLTKAYASFKCGRSSNAFTAVAGKNPDLASSVKLFDHFRSAANRRHLGAYSLVSEWSLRPSEEICQQQLLFSCADWNWTLRGGFLELIQHLSEGLTLDLSSLYALLGIFARHGIQLRPFLFGIGRGHPKAAVAFHFVPIVKHALTSSKEDTFGPPADP